MIMIEVILVILFLILSGLAAKSDLQSGLILNKMLLPFVGIAVILDFIYYGFLARDIAVDFIINLLLIIVIGMLLFYTHSFAGGDCKLSIVFALLYPARFYFVTSGKVYTLYIAIGLAIFYGYLYLLAGSLWKIISRKKKVEISYVRRYLFSFLKSFVIVTIYISAISLIVIIMETVGIMINPWISRGLCMIIAWLIGKKQAMKKPVTVGILLIIDIVLVFITRVIPISINPSNYLLAVVLLICQMTISTDLYDEVAVSDLKKGMILSTMASLVMQKSRVRGLPGISSEDLRNRLTDTEVESIKRWAKSRNVESITVVRKIPFAIFLVMGYITYFVLGSVF